MCPATGYHELRQCFGSSLKMLPACHHMLSLLAGRGGKRDTQQENSYANKSSHTYILSVTANLAEWMRRHRRISTRLLSGTFLRRKRKASVYVGWSFNSGTEFLSEWVDLPASWYCLLQNSVLVFVCTYSSAPATDESTSGSHFFNSP